MDRRSCEILIVGGGAAGMSAALAASGSSKKITVVDDNPRLGGQIWRAELGRTKSPEAVRLINAIEARRIEIVTDAQVFDAENNALFAETPNGLTEFDYEKLIVATGARERLLPFPGWTLPGVFGAGGLQALVKGGLSVKGKRIVVAGTGPLLLAVAEYLKSKGANLIAIVEQAKSSDINRFALRLFGAPSKLTQAVKLKKRLLGVPYITNSWVVSVKCGSPRVSKDVTSDEADTLSITLHQNGRQRVIECDYLACGFHLVANMELAELLNCAIENGFVVVDEFQQTSQPNIFCSGEPNGIGGVEASLVEGAIAGHAAAGNDPEARKLFRKRDKTRRFADALNHAFALRDELKYLAADDTVVCRCEDVQYGQLKEFTSSRSAKLQTRCGMGACQGRVCGAATEFIFGWERGAVRPPIFPVKLENL